MIKVCLTCQNEFRCYTSQINKKYCSRACVPVNLGNAVRWKDKTPVAFSCVICNKSFSVRPSRVGRTNVKYCSFHCHQVGEGIKGGEVRGGQLRESVARKAPEDRKSYPKIKGRHAHRIIAEKMLGRSLRRGEVVHHHDENIQNYSEDNLVVLSDQGEHMKIHRAKMLEARKEQHGY